MKVTAVRVLDAVRRDSRRDATPQPATVRRPPDDCAIEVLTDAGLTGVGIVTQSARASVESLARELLVGEDPRGVTGLWQRMADVQGSRPGDAPLQAAKAALDVALWDLKASSNDEPLWKALGGSQPCANAHASSVDDVGNGAALAEWSERMAREFGLRGAQVRSGLIADEDCARLDRVRTALRLATPEPVLGLDFGRRCPAKHVIRFVREIEQSFDLAWIEGAAPDWDFPALKQVSNAVRCAVAVGRGLATPGEFLAHFHHRSADIIQIDIGVTGVTGALQLADAAYGYELPVMLVASHGNIHAHLAGAMPYFMSAEVVDPAPESSLYRTAVRVDRGVAIAGDAPGHGMTVRAETPAGTAASSGTPT